MWLVARSMLVNAAAALVQVLDPTPRMEEGRRHGRLRSNMPPRNDSERILVAGCGTCSLATTLRNAAVGTYAREGAVYASLAMSLEELMAIDDIEPPDAWDHRE